MNREEQFRAASAMLIGFAKSAQSIIKHANGKPHEGWLEKLVEFANQADALAPWSEPEGPEPPPNAMRSPEDEAAARYAHRSPMDRYAQFEEQGYAACYREHVIPAQERRNAWQRLGHSFECGLTDIACRCWPYTQTPIETMNTEPNDKQSNEDEAGQLRQAVVVRSAIGHSVDDDDMQWTVNCPECNKEYKCEGYLESTDTDTCKCGCVYRTERVYFEDGSFME